MLREKLSSLVVKFAIKCNFIYSLHDKTRYYRFIWFCSNEREFENSFKYLSLKTWIICIWLPRKTSFDQIFWWKVMKLDTKIKTKMQLKQSIMTSHSLQILRTNWIKNFDQREFCMNELLPMWTWGNVSKDNTQLFRC